MALRLRPARHLNKPLRGTEWDGTPDAATETSLLWMALARGGCADATTPARHRLLGAWAGCAYVLKLGLDSLALTTKRPNFGLELWSELISNATMFVASNLYYMCIWQLMYVSPNISFL